MIKLLYIFVAIALLNFINLSKYVQCKRNLDRYYDWLSGKERNWQLVEHKSQVIKLFKHAGVQDSYRPHIEPMGLGYVGTATISVLNNFPHARMDLATATVEMFHQAIGVYRSRMLETFNPLYWIESVINLPKQVLAYLGVSSESVVIRIAQVLWWAFGVVFGFIFVLYRLEIEQIVRNWMSGFVP